MNGIETIVANLAAIGAELRKPSLLPIRRDELAEFVRNLDGGYVIETGDEFDMCNRALWWRYVDDLPSGYVGHYYVGGCPFGLRRINSAAEKLIAASIYADHQRGFTLD